MQYEREYEKAHEASSAAAREAIQKANDAREAAEDVKKISSGNTEQQIDGTTGRLKDINSKANNNSLSETLSDKTLSIMDQMGQKESELLKSTGNTVEKAGSMPAGTGATYTAGPHELRESAGGSAQVSISDQFQNRANTLLSSSSSGSSQPASQSNSSTTNATHETDLESQFESRGNTLLENPSVVSSMTKAEDDRQKQIAAVRAQNARIEKEQQVEKARQEAALRKAQVEAAKTVASEPTSTHYYSPEDDAYAENWIRHREAEWDAADARAAAERAFRAMGIPLYSTRMPDYIPLISTGSTAATSPAQGQTDCDGHGHTGAELGYCK